MNYSYYRWGYYEDSRLFAFLSWVLFIIGAIIALLIRPYDRYVVFHAKQSIVFSLIVLILHVLLSSLSYLGFFIFGWIFWILDRLLIVGSIAFAIVCGIRAWEGEWFRIPLIYDFARQF
ncbi:MAG: DUF4870 domain-containing protein [Thermoproteales archaeon]|nr:DUF4870 domain-containing protein [Thermoproteales archaeon]